MKLFKNIFLIIALVAMNSVSVQAIRRPAGEQPAPTQQPPAPGQQVIPGQQPPVPGQQPAPTQVIPSLPGKNFQYYMSQVRNNMTSAQVITPQGLFTKTFLDFVKSSGLSPELMEALLEAGRSLHLPLSGDDKSDLALIDYSQDKIDLAMKDYKAAPSQATQLTAAEQRFYDTRTELFKQDFLNSKVKELSESIDQKNAEMILIRELMPLITNVWKKRGILKDMTPEPARKQIIMAVQNKYKRWSQPTPQIRDAWYNGWTRLIDEKYLQNFIREAVAQDKTPTKYQKELEDLERQIKARWEQEGITQKEKTRLAKQLNQQLEDVDRKISKKEILPGLPLKPAPSPAPVPKPAMQPQPAPQPVQQPQAQPGAIATITKLDKEPTPNYIARLLEKNDLMIDTYLVSEDANKENIFEVSDKNKSVAVQFIKNLHQDIKDNYSTFNDSRATRLLAEGFDKYATDVLNMKDTKPLTDFVKRNAPR